MYVLLTVRLFHNIDFVNIARWCGRFKWNTLRLHHRRFSRADNRNPLGFYLEISLKNTMWEGILKFLSNSL